VLGREFEVHVLAAMLQDDNTISEQIAQAEKRIFGQQLIKSDHFYPWTFT